MLERISLIILSLFAVIGIVRIFLDLSWDFFYSELGSSAIVVSAREFAQLSPDAKKELLALGIGEVDAVDDAKHLNMGNYVSGIVELEDVVISTLKSYGRR